MIMKIILEFIIAIIIIMAGTTFWILLKRDRFLVKAMQDDKLISNLVTRERMDAFNLKQKETVANKTIIPYPERIKIWQLSDKKTQILLKTISITIALLVIVASVKLSPIILALNVTIFLLTAFVPIGSSGRINAFNHIMLLTTIMDEWLKTNKDECERWVGQNARFKNILNALILLT